MAFSFGSANNSYLGSTNSDDQFEASMQLMRQQQAERYAAYARRVLAGERFPGYQMDYPPTLRTDGRSAPTAQEMADAFGGPPAPQQPRGLFAAYLAQRPGPLGDWSQVGSPVVNALTGLFGNYVPPTAQANVLARPTTKPR
jgi:hypothetical protein